MAIVNFEGKQYRLPDGLSKEEMIAKIDSYNTPTKEEPTVDTSEFSQEASEPLGPKVEDSWQGSDASLFDHMADLWRSVAVNRNLSRDAVTTAMRTRQAIPEYDDAGELVRVRKETDAEFKERIKRREAVRRKESHIEEGSGKDIAGDILSEVVDPVGWMVTPSVKGATLTTKLLKMAAVGGVYEGTAGALDQQAKAGEIESGKDVLVRAGMGAAGFPIAERVFSMGGAFLRKAHDLDHPGVKFDPSKVTDESFTKASRLVDEFNGRVAYYMDRSFHPELPQTNWTLPQMQERALMDMGIKPEWLRDATVHSNMPVKLLGKAERSNNDTYVKLVKAARSKEIEHAKGNASQLVEDVLGIWSTAVKNISPRLFFGARRFEQQVMHRTSTAVREASPFFTGLKKSIPKAKQEDLHRALFNGDFKLAEEMMQEHAPDMIPEFNKVRKLLGTYKDELKEVGWELDIVDNYFPRLVTDQKGLRKVSGEAGERLTRSEERKAARQLIDDNKTKTTGTTLNKELRGVRGKAVPVNKLSAAKERAIDKLSPEQLKYYADPARAFEHYIFQAASNIEKRKFFGKHLQNGKDGGIDYDVSIGKLVADELGAGTINTNDVKRLRKLFEARFVDADAPQSKAVTDVKNLYYISTIGQVDSALTQAGDLAVSGYYNGVANTLKSLLGKKHAHLSDIGVNQIAQEMSHTGRTAWALDTTLRTSGFKAIDFLGKRVNINAGLRKLQRTLRTPEGEREFLSEYAPAFGDVRLASKVAEDIRANNITDDVAFVLFNRLADVQPIAMSEYPVAYLRNPNGRILYALSSFFLKQMDLLRNTAIKKMQEPGAKAKLKGAKDLTKYSTYMALSGATIAEVKDFMMGKDTPFSEHLANNLIKNFGLSNYSVNKLIEDKDLGAFMALELPGLNILTDIANDKGEKNLPVVGRLFYNWFGGGREKWQERKEQREMQEMSGGLSGELE